MTTELRSVSDDEIAAYQEMIDFHAHRLDGFEGAEYDDLAQEGLIAVWDALKNGEHPSKDIIVGRMHSWARKVARQRRGEIADESVLAG